MTAEQLRTLLDQLDEARIYHHCRLIKGGPRAPLHERHAEAIYVAMAMIARELAKDKTP